MLDVLTYGEVLWDMIEGKAHIGGAPFNLAAHAVKCGLRAATVSSVGDDDLGRAALGEMDRLSVERRWTLIDREHPTGTVTVSLTGGQPSYVIHEGVAWDFIRLSRDALLELVAARPRAICFGSLAQRGEVSRETFRMVVRALPEAIRFYDVNLRQKFWDRDTFASGLEIATLVKVNDEEARTLGQLLFGCRSKPGGFCHAALSAFPGILAVVVTCGGNGCTVCQRGSDPVECPGIPVQVADAVGAGDAFSAAFLAEWLKGEGAVTAAQAGNRRGAWVASRFGAVPDES